MKALYFFRGLWRELVCLFGKTSGFRGLDGLMQAAILWTVAGFSFGTYWLGWCGVTQSVAFWTANEPEHLDTFYWISSVLFMFISGLLGIIIAWVPVGFVILIVLFIKHTIEVGQR